MILTRTISFLDFSPRSKLPFGSLESLERGLLPFIGGTATNASNAKFDTLQRNRSSVPAVSDLSRTE